MSEASASSATTSATVLEQADAERKQARRESWRLLRRRPGFIIGMVIVVFWLVCAILEKRITPYDPFTYTTKAKLAPSADHWFGTDKIGRDIFSRVLAGARDVLVVAPPAAVLGVSLGTFVGMTMGYFRGRVDLVLSRIVEAFLALPVVLVGLLVLSLAGTSSVLAAITFDSRKVLVIYVVALLFTPIVARTVRAAVIAERDLDYVTSARLRGESATFIMTREVLPNIAAPIVVELTVRIGYAIFTVSTLSFLGVGVQRPSPDWGLAISEGRDVLQAGIWWPVTFPALAIATLVIGVNLVADSIQAVYER
ncbi:MAG: peptide/nickel transport system permease protein [Acidimicrobiaceae bacterium]|nr:MAG: peptide/nickel transport system permease protein [Acidimicrobiaceae bacterium]